MWYLPIRVPAASSRTVLASDFPGKRVEMCYLDLMSMVNGTMYDEDEYILSAIKFLHAYEDT